MRSDIDRWNQKYSQAKPVSFADADRTLQALGGWFDGVGEALDLACGAGANLQWLFRRGYAVTGMDGSLHALRLACQQPDGGRFRLLAVDLDNAVLPGERYAAIVVVHYLNRALFPSIISALKPGGRLFYKTFNTNLLDQRPGFNPDYLLEPGELARAFDSLTPCVVAEPDTADPSNSWVVMEKPEQAIA